MNSLIEKQETIARSYSHEENMRLLDQLTPSGVETPLTRYQDWIAETVRKNRADEVFQKHLLPIIEEERPYVGSVFLSVVMRTQGRRPEALREALLCLYAQSCQDFEVLLIAHKPNDEQLTNVERALDDLEPEFRKQVRFYVLDFGQRSMPLNIGFAHARGEYIAVLDDDDLVLEDWVLEFKKGAEANPGKLLHAYCFGQEWKSIQGGGLQAYAAPQSQCCSNFFLTHQLLSNFCPLISLGFPRIAFTEYAIIFDDVLTTAEDWDCFMRTAILFGVADIEEATSIYRLWVNLENSHSVHNEQTWKRNYKIVLNKFRNHFVLFAPDDVSDLIKEIVPDVDCIDAPSEEVSADAADTSEEDTTTAIALSAAASSEPVDIDVVGPLDLVTEAEPPYTLSEVLTSRSWKAGRAVTFIPRLLRDFVVLTKNNGLMSALRYTGRKVMSITKLFSVYFGK